MNKLNAVNPWEIIQQYKKERSNATVWVNWNVYSKWKKEANHKKPYSVGFHLVINAYLDNLVTKVVSDWLGLGESRCVDGGEGSDDKVVQLFWEWWKCSKIKLW